MRVSDDISSKWPAFLLKWADQRAGFAIFDLMGTSGGKISIGDDADYLHLFMIMADRIHQSKKMSEPLLIAADSGGNRVLVRRYSAEEQAASKYAYIALGNTVKQLPETAINGTISFFAVVTLETAGREGFEREARKAARSMPGDVRKAWEAIIEQRLDFLKTDLYVFQMLRLFSWGFRAIGQEPSTDTTYCFVRPKRPQPRGASRH